MTTTRRPRPRRGRNLGFRPDLFDTSRSVALLLGGIALLTGTTVAVYTLREVASLGSVGLTTLRSVASALLVGGFAILVLRRRITLPLRHVILCGLIALAVASVVATTGTPIASTFSGGLGVTILLAFAVIRSRAMLWYPLVVIPLGIAATAWQPGAQAGDVALTGLLAVVTTSVLTWFVRSASAFDTDWLTGILNFGGFERATATTVQDARANARTGVPLTLARLDIDEFALVNQRFGADAGDDALGEFATDLASLLPADAVFGRIEGDAFAVLISGSTADEVRGLLRKARSTVRGFSAGIAQHEGDESASELFGRAGAALYEAKRGGLGRITVHGGYYASPIEVRHGIETGEIFVVYQPCVDMRTGAIVGVEALARWHHPTRGAISPVEFIPLCEASGSIMILGDWVLGQAIAAAAGWNRGLPTGRSEVAVAINASARELSTAGYAERVIALCTAAGLRVSLLRIEATESDFGSGSEEVAVNIAQLRGSGALISMDDFGTGFSSLERLTRTRVDVVKIDRQFVSAIDSLATEAPVIDLAIGLATALSLGIVAEGVETPVQAQWLVERGCYFAQGFLYSRPIRYGELVQVLRDNEF
ncbi:putative bifunctional diguanylate cyclase/phosphodiesterase [Cryobacterium zhongshanensis]|uniref:Bifunctional diguanylate cyclase/phosphodiesterase n=1 Tax=Cryobacterium zhongshanensis TaxID=2928153 RepID=A0AA41QXZ5_9MICO|nr:bifunctional diguanylate cyclase/phosphodiesterase [Cryobacterium zhongshanensis]MCI4658968.1 bifunctional diguanylate cyclase/phosphodiesterase [Cryobacterium zhongshanensis]